MPTPPLTNEQCIEAVAAVARHHGSHERAAAELGLNLNTFKGRLRKASERGLAGTDPVMPGFRIARVSTTEGADGAIKSRSIVQKPDTDEVSFAIPQGHRVKGVSALVDGNGNVTQTWYKTREDGRDPADIADEIKAAFTGFDLRAPSIAAPIQTDDDLAAVYIAADWHVGALSWRRETGTNWDLKIAQEVIGDSVSRLVTATPAARQAVVLGLGDLMHSDGYDPMTAKSKNILDVDGRYPRVLQAATSLLIATVTKALSKHEKVLVRILPGNHDSQSAIAVSLALAMYYSENDRVTVDDDPSYFWWWSWGETLLGATHGDAAKMKDLPLIMASRNAEAWGKSKYRHVYTGHIHTQTSYEFSGVTVESFQSPVAADAWHHKMGYGATRAISSVVLHRKHGEIARNKINIV
jgi:transposase-like protein